MTEFLVTLWTTAEGRVIVVLNCQIFRRTRRQASDALEACPAISVVWRGGHQPQPDGFSIMLYLGQFFSRQQGGIKIRKSQSLRTPILNHRGPISLASLPFEHLNLRRNPFGEFSAEERTQLAIVELTAALNHLQSSFQKHPPVLQVIGEKGFGKTTHLLSIAAHFPSATYIHIPEGNCPNISVEGEPLLIDEAQRLTLGQRLWLFRSQRTLVLGTHRDFTQHLEWAGRAVLTLNAAQHTTPERIEQILNDRIRSVRRSSGPIPTVTSASASALFTLYGSDLRSIQHHLYDVFQSLGSVQDV